MKQHRNHPHTSFSKEETQLTIRMWGTTIVTLVVFVFY